jgi:hypothetical protein
MNNDMLYNHAIVSNAHAKDAERILYTHTRVVT